MGTGKGKNKRMKIETLASSDKTIRSPLADFPGKGELKPSWISWTDDNLSKYYLGYEKKDYNKEEKEYVLTQILQDIVHNKYFDYIIQGNELTDEDIAFLDNIEHQVLEIKIRSGGKYSEGFVTVYYRGKVCVNLSNEHKSENSFLDIVDFNLEPAKDYMHGLMDRDKISPDLVVINLIIAMINNSRYTTLSKPH